MESKFQSGCSECSVSHLFETKFLKSLPIPELQHTQTHNGDAQVRAPASQLNDGLSIGKITKTVQKSPEKSWKTNPGLDGGQIFGA